MIKNDKQLKEAEVRFKSWQESFEKMRKELKPESFRIYQFTHEPELRELYNAINEYKRLKLKLHESAYFRDPMEVGRWIIRERIRQSMTQEMLANNIRTSQSQISREEDSEYRNTSLMRIYEIMQVLGYPIFEMASFKNKEDMALSIRDRRATLASNTVSTAQAGDIEDRKVKAADVVDSKEYSNNQFEKVAA